jgi:hypothetical protein
MRSLWAGNLGVKAALPGESAPLLPKTHKTRTENSSSDE